MGERIGSVGEETNYLGIVLALWSHLRNIHGAGRDIL